jgi:hypothetical protein
MLKTWLKEPLLHFIVAGGLLFAAYGWLNPGASGGDAKTVRIISAEMNWLKETWTRQWQRPPDAEELRGILTGYLKEELLAREARELGLDFNDTVVCRRLAQKMEFFLQDTVALAEPGEDALRRLHEANPGQYRSADRVSFSQRYFKSAAAAQEALAQLAHAPEAVVGDITLLEPDYADVDAQAVTSIFGGGFADKVFALQADAWHGPIASGYGFHLARVNARQEGEIPPFEAVRGKARDEWQRIEQAKAAEQFYASLLEKYQVILDDSVKPLIGPLARVAQ